MVEEGASCSDEATDDDRRSVVVNGAVKAAGACRGRRRVTSQSTIGEAEVLVSQLV